MKREEFVSKELYMKTLADFMRAFELIIKRLDALVPTEADLEEARKHFAHIIAHEECRRSLIKLDKRGNS